MSFLMLVIVILTAFFWFRMAGPRRLPPPLVVLGVLFGLMVLAVEAWLIPLAVMLLAAWIVARAFRNHSTPHATPRPPVTQPLPEHTGAPSADFSRFLQDLDQFNRDVRELLAGSTSVRTSPPSQSVGTDRRFHPGQPPASTNDELTASLDILIREHAATLPPEGLVRLATMRERLRESGTYLRDRGLMSGDAGYRLRQIATDYLPGAVRAYARLPRGHADTTPLADGRTGRDLLIGQLDLLETAMHDILAGVTRAEAQDLFAHGRFLEEKFDPKRKDFEV